MKHLSLFRLLVLVLLLASAAAAGVIATVVTNRSLDAYGEALLNARPAVDLALQSPSPIPGTYEEALSRVRRNALPSVVAFTAVSQDSLVAAEFFGDDVVQGYGMVVSADGWVVTQARALAKYEDPLAEAEAWNRGQRFSLLEIVKDTRTDFVLVKIAADRLPVSGFGAADDVRAGELAFLLTADQLLATSIVSADEATDRGAVPAETFATTWRLHETSDITRPIVNAAGELVGMTGVEGATPLHHGLGFVQEVLRGSGDGYAVLGAYTVDLAHAWNVDTGLSAARQTGALILGPDASVRAVPLAGAAAQAGLAVRDIITAVDDEPITADKSLAELLDAYNPGQSVRLSILRNGEWLTIPVTLGSSSDLVY